MIKPTVGRLVWYRPAEFDAGNTDATDQRFAATIAKVLSDDLVNLMVIDGNGHPFARAVIELVQEGKLEPGQCQWPC